MDKRSKKSLPKRFIDGVAASITLTHILLYVTQNQTLYVRTVWKFQNFTATQILREADFRRSKNAILTIFEALNFEIFELLTFENSPKYQNSETPKC